MERSRPQLNLDELQRLRWLLGGLLVLLSVWTVVYADIDAWLLTGATTLAVLAGLSFPTLPARVPSLVHKLAFPFIVVFFVWDLYTSGEPLPAMMRLDLLLLLYRGVSYRRKRDDLQIIVLGLILVMMAGVLTVSLVFALQILVFTAVTLAFLFVINLSEHAAGSAVIAIGAEGPVPAWARLGWRRFARRLAAVADPRLLLLSGALFAGVVAVSALLFTAIPRFQLDTGFFLDRLISKKSLTGFSDTIRLGDVVDIQQDNSVALRVDVSDPAQVPARPYWRMVVLDEYHDGVLRMSRRLRDETVTGARLRPSLSGTLPRPTRPAVVWTFYLEAGISRYLPLTGSFYRLRFQDPLRVFEQYPLSIVALRNEPVTMTAYRVDDMSTDGFVRDLMFGPMLRHAERVRAAGRTAKESGRVALTYPLTTLQLPAHAADREVLRRMVGQIMDGGKIDAEAFAARATAWLRRRHGYSLHVTLPGGGRDPVVAWLKSDLPGHCELFAAAFTLLSRAAGFPTRAVTGFRGGDWNAFENYYMVRDSNAHAWCEVYNGRTGWFRVDPTPGQTAAVGPQTATAAVSTIKRPDRSWRARLDALRILWYRRVVSFDQRSQMAIVQSVRDTAISFGEALRSVLGDWTTTTRRWLRRPWDSGRLLRWLGLIVGAGLAFVLAWKGGRAWRWSRGRRRRSGRTDPVRCEAGRWLRKLARLATPEPRGGAVVPDLQLLRYGPSRSWPEPAAVFRRARLAVRDGRRLTPARAGTNSDSGEAVTSSNG